MTNAPPKIFGPKQVVLIAGSVLIGIALFFFRRSHEDESLFVFYDHWSGLVEILGGIYASLMGFGFLPRKPKNSERLAVWQRKFGPMMRVLGPSLVVVGLVEVVRHL